MANLDEWLDSIQHANLTFTKIQKTLLFVSALGFFFLSLMKYYPLCRALDGSIRSIKASGFSVGDKSGQTME